MPLNCLIFLTSSIYGEGFSEAGYTFFSKPISQLGLIILDHQQKICLCNVIVNDIMYFFHCSTPEFLALWQVSILEWGGGGETSE